MQECLACQAVRNTPALAPLHPWPTKPWQRVHVDFASPFMGRMFRRMFMVVVDAHAKWPEVIPMSSTTSSNTIDELRRLFAAYGLPRRLVSDNGPQFTSDEFATFCRYIPRNNQRTICRDTCNNHRRTDRARSSKAAGAIADSIQLGNDSSLNGLCSKTVSCIS